MRDAWIDAHSRGAPPLTLTCSDVNQDWPDECTSNPPVEPSDGCTMVPDFAFADPTLEPIFTPSCGAHDVCYSTYYGTSRATCNTKLKSNLEAICYSHFAVYRFDQFNDPIQYWHDLNQRNSCILQADIYYGGLTYGPTAS